MNFHVSTHRPGYQESSDWYASTTTDSLPEKSKFPYNQLLHAFSSSKLPPFSLHSRLLRALISTPRTCHSRPANCTVCHYSDLYLTFWNRLSYELSVGVITRNRAVTSITSFFLFMHLPVVSYHVSASINPLTYLIIGSKPRSVFSCYRLSNYFPVIFISFFTTIASGAYTRFAISIQWASFTNLHRCALT